MTGLFGNIINGVRAAVDGQFREQLHQQEKQRACDDALQKLSTDEAKLYHKFERLARSAPIEDWKDVPEAELRGYAGMNGLGPWLRLQAEGLTFEIGYGCNPDRDGIKTGQYMIGAGGAVDISIPRMYATVFNRSESDQPLLLLDEGNPLADKLWWTVEMERESERSPSFPMREVPQGRILNSDG